MTPLCELAVKHGTDKTRFHEYTPVYYNLLKDREIKKVLEIGVCEGASLRMWREFFPQAEIFGIEFNPLLMINNEPRIHTICCDQSDADALTEAAVGAGSDFDLIIDDGSHVLSHQLISMRALLPFLALDGIYVVEDVGAYNAHTAEDEIIKAVPVGYVCEVPVCPPSKCPDEKLIVIRRSQT